MGILRNLYKITNSLRIYSRNLSTNTRPVQEVQIPISGGFIAGKWWGPHDKRPILTYHGWQDNCGSFDRLIPQLPENVPVLAVDLPGHGFSYRVPPGSAYHNIDSVIVTKQIKNYFGWEKITLMGHSMGATVSYAYGYLFPEEVDFMVCIDGLNPLINPRGLDRVARSVEQQIKYDALNRSNEEPPSYTLPEMERKMNESTRKSVDVTTAKHILYRNIAPSQKNPGKFYFNRDARLKVGPLQVLDVNELIRVTEKLTFPLHFTKSEEGPYFGNEAIFKRLNPVLEKCNKHYVFRFVPGPHHGHLNTPECVSKLITDFIREHDKADRSKGGLKAEIIVDESIYPIYKYKKDIFGEL